MENPAEVFDPGVASDNSAGLTREEHLDFHEQGEFKEIIGQIADEVGAEVDARGDFDFRGFLVSHTSNHRYRTSHGEIYIGEEGILVIQDSRFKKDHVGRDRFAVYASSPEKVTHELTELDLWYDFVFEELYCISEYREINEKRFSK